MDARSVDGQRRDSLGDTSRLRCWRPSRRRAGSCPRATFEAIENLPNWNDWAPRFAVVYDLFGNGKTALKYSLNRYNLARTTGIAVRLQPAASLTTTLPWRDVNGDDIAAGRSRLHGIPPSAGCEINFAALPANFGPAALNTYGDYPRTWNLENALELQHELLPEPLGARRTGSRAASTTRRSASTRLVARPITRRTRCTTRSTGEPFTVYGRSAAAQARPTNNLDTFDPERKQDYQAFELESRYRPDQGRRPDLRRRARSSGNGTRTARRRTIPTTCRLDDHRCRSSTPSGCATTTSIDIPWRHGRQAVGIAAGGLGPQRQHGVPEQHSPTTQPAHDGHSRHDSLSGQLPGAVPGRRDHHADAHLQSVHADLQPRCRERGAGRAHRPARLQGEPHLPLRPGAACIPCSRCSTSTTPTRSSATSRPTAERRLPGAQQHHAGPAYGRASTFAGSRTCGREPERSQSRADLLCFPEGLVAPKALPPGFFASLRRRNLLVAFDVSWSWGPPRALAWRRTMCRTASGSSWLAGRDLVGAAARGARAKYHSPAWSGTRGAVLPGVTVEAASPVLIEGIKTAVTDGYGGYRIVDLRPGTYAVTFTLTGFKRSRARGRRAAHRLHGHDQRRARGRRSRGDRHCHRRVTGRGRLEHMRASQVLTREVLDAIPTGRNIYGMCAAGHRRQR